MTLSPVVAQFIPTDCCETGACASETAAVAAGAVPEVQLVPPGAAAAALGYTTVWISVLATLLKWNTDGVSATSIANSAFFK